MLRSSLFCFFNLIKVWALARVHPSHCNGRICLPSNFYSFFVTIFIIALCRGFTIFIHLCFLWQIFGSTFAATIWYLLKIRSFFITTKSSITARRGCYSIFTLSKKFGLIIFSTSNFFTAQAVKIWMACRIFIFVQWCCHVYICLKLCPLFWLDGMVVFENDV